MGVWIHSLAAKYTVKDLGPRAMTANEIVNYLPMAFDEVEKYK